MKLSKFATSVMGLLAIGFLSSTTAQAATTTEYFPKLAKAEDAPTNPAVNQAPKGKHGKKVIKKAAKLAKVSRNR